eukprot:2074829-Rhodomonas_salina.1
MHRAWRGFNESVGGDLPWVIGLLKLVRHSYRNTTEINMLFTATHVSILAKVAAQVASRWSGRHRVTFPHESIPAFSA